MLVDDCLTLLPKSRITQRKMSQFHVNNLFNLSGYVCLVTGAGTGIGPMATQALSHNGAKVYAAGRRGEVLQKSAEVHAGDGEVIPLEMDVTDKESITAAVEFIKSRESKLDLLINNAGLASNKANVEKGDTDVDAFSKDLFEDPMSNWEDTYRTNVFALYYTSVAFVPLLTKGNHEDKMHKVAKDFSPSIINICSISGITKTTQHGQFAYNSSKAATIQLNRLLATEFSRSNISVRVNSIAPGYFPSEMTTSESNSENKSEMKQEGWRKEKMVPADRPGKDEDMAMAVIMLAKNTYVNGQTIVVDGGLLIEMP